MLWYKGWLETRFRMLLMLGMGLFFLVMSKKIPNRQMPPLTLGAF